MPPSLKESDGTLKAPSPGKGMLYVYRPSAFYGGGVFYDLHDSAQGDKVLGTITSGSVIAAELEPGSREIWAKTEAKVSVPVTIEAGKTQCVKAGVGMGLLVGRPTLEKAALDQCRKEVSKIVLERKKREEEAQKGDDLGFGFAHKKR